MNCSKFVARVLALHRISQSNRAELKLSDWRCSVETHNCMIRPRIWQTDGRHSNLHLHTSLMCSLSFAYCSWRMFSNMFNVAEIISVAEIILFRFQTWLYLLKLGILFVQICAYVTAPILSSGNSKTHCFQQGYEFIPTKHLPPCPSDSAIADDARVYKFHLLLTYLLT